LLAYFRYKDLAKKEEEDKKKDEEEMKDIETNK